jgi:hypothetical protein
VIESGTQTANHDETHRRWTPEVQPERDSRAGKHFAVRLDEMKSFHEGQLVTLVGEDEALDGIVVHAPSLVKVEVAVPDSAHGTVFRTVHPKVLRERSVAGEHDDALRKQIRRTGFAGRGGPRTGPGSGRRGHSQPSGHRTTGK